MNEKDKAAFSAAWAHFSSKFDKDAWEFKEGFEAALAHHDARVAGLVEALRKMIEVQHPATMFKYKQEAVLKAQQALDAWEANK